MRASQKALSASLGTAVVIDNQPGAGGIVGTQTLVKAAPDGATLSVVSNNHVIYPKRFTRRCRLTRSGHHADRRDRWFANGAGGESETAGARREGAGRPAEGEAGHR